MNNSYNIIKFDSNYDDLVNSGVISPLNRYKYSFYINSDKLFFKEDTDRMYYELIGTAIGDYLNILHTSYKLTMIETSDTKIKGVTSKDYREDGYKLIKFNNILFGKEMTLDNISERLNIYFNDYRNKDIIVNDIYNDVITYYMLDLLLGNIDNGKYNYEFMVSDTNAKMSPYSDFGMIFNFSSTKLRVNEYCNSSIYDNLNELLSMNKEYLTRFSSMYEKLTPNKLEEIINDVEKNNKVDFGSNFKNIIFLSYSRHYVMLGNIINTIKKNSYLTKK